MTTGLLLFIAVTVAIAGSALFTRFTLWILPRRQRARTHLHRRFSRFAQRVADKPFSEEVIERFWNSTADTYALASEISIINLRNELHDNAYQLLNERFSSNSQSDITDKHLQLLEWFDSVQLSIDAAFERDFRESHPQWRTAVGECWHLTRLALRA